MLTVKSPRRCTNSLVPSSGSTRKNTGACTPWLVGLLLGHHRDLGKGRREAAGDDAVGELVGLGDRRGVGLGADREVVALVDREDRRARLEGEPAHGGDDTGIIHGSCPYCALAAKRMD